MRSSECQCFDALLLVSLFLKSPPAVSVPAALTASAHALALMLSPVQPEERRLDVRRASKMPQRLASSRSALCSCSRSLAKKHSVASAALVALFLRSRLEPHVGMRTP